jgi:hypothetical protein
MRLPSRSPKYLLNQAQKTSHPSFQKYETPVEEVVYPETSYVQQGISYSEPRQYRAVGWQPMKRLVAWQPMKKSVGWQPLKRDPDTQIREQGKFRLPVAISPVTVIMTIEEKLSDVLRAGEKLGVSPDEVLAHLRSRNHE